MRRYYQLLGVSEDATPEQIEKAYKRAASKHHPDKNLGNETEAANRFKEVKEAYECLSDPERRQVYDDTGDTTIKTGNPAEDLLLHLLNEITDQLNSAFEVIEKTKSVISEMIDECRERKFRADQKIVALEGMIRALRFRGKGTNLLEGLFREKIKRLMEERAELDTATAAATEVHARLEEYEATDQPPPDPEEEGETVESLQVKFLNDLLSEVFDPRGRANRSGRRKGGMPFSGV